jgi:hypothetical protein
MTFKDDSDNSEDIFSLKLIEWTENRSSMDENGIFEINKDVIKSLTEREVNIFYKFYISLNFFIFNLFF